MARVHIEPRFQSKISPSDVFHDAFVSARRGFSEFRGDGEIELAAWLRRILANQMAMHVRSFTTQQRDVRLEVRLEDSLNRSSVALAAYMADSASSPSRHVVKREQAVMVAEALSTLPAEMREVMILRHLEHHNFPEIARRMGRPLENVKSLWRRGIKQLRDTLSNENSS
jgi:RNA polymerase sigma-70 factor (subfamily 1)